MNTKSNDDRGERNSGPLQVKTALAMALIERMLPSIHHWNCTAFRSKPIPSFDAAMILTRGGLDTDKPHMIIAFLGSWGLQVDLLDR